MPIPLCISLLPSLHLPSLSHAVQPFIRGPPGSLTVNQSSPATFSCTAQGNPVPTISWTGPSANFTTNDTLGTNFTVLSVLTIDSAAKALHEGYYTCTASNGVGPSPSNSAALTIQGMYCRISSARPTAPHCTSCFTPLHYTRQSKMLCLPL